MEQILKYTTQYSIFLLFCISSMLFSCGYKPTHRVSSIFPSSDVRLGIQNITNPTLHTQIPYYLRSSLYNEITNRNIARWRMESPMDYGMEVIVINYRITPRTVVEDDVALLYIASIQIRVIIYEYATGKEYWHSPVILTEKIYNTFANEVVLPDLLSLATQNIVDAMQIVF